MILAKLCHKNKNKLVLFRGLIWDIVIRYHSDRVQVVTGIVIVIGYTRLADNT